MQFEKWLKREGRSKTWAANKLGIPEYKLSRLFNGVGLEPIIINDIAILTNDECVNEDWVTLLKKLRRAKNAK